jgi:hypothetical protein
MAMHTVHGGERGTPGVCGFVTSFLGTYLAAEL